MTTNALILAGGLGTRLRPLTEHTPKCLVSIGGRPLLDFWVDALNVVRVQRAVINTHHLPGPVRRHIAEVNARGAVRLEESHETTLLGSAGTVTANASLADGADEVILVYADNLSDLSLAEALRFHRGHDLGFTMVLFRAPNPRACGIAKLDEQATVVEFVEKPDHPASNLANAGVYLLEAAVYREIAEMNAFDLGFDVIPRFVGRMKGFIHEGYHRDIGSLEALDLAEGDLRNGRGPRPATGAP
jgi:mannose-1-phosphate guanylyltransferase